MPVLLVSFCPRTELTLATCATALNPFAKKAAVAKPDAASSSMGHFGSKKGGAKAANNVSRTGSFFGRVEGNEAPKSSSRSPRFPLRTR